MKASSNQSAMTAAAGQNLSAEAGQNQSEETAAGQNQSEETAAETAVAAAVAGQP
jgi:hypothetical protein